MRHPVMRSAHLTLCALVAASAHALALAPAVHVRIPHSHRMRARRCECSGQYDEMSSPSGQYEETSSPVRALVSWLTALVGGDTSTEAVDRPPRPGIVTPAALLDGVRADYVERLYLWTGDIDPELYDDDCVFTDPTLSFRGLETFQKNLAALQPFLSALVKDPAIDLFSCELDEPEQKLRASWRMRGDLALPWKPAIDLTGRTTFTYDEERNGRIVDYREDWELDAGRALMQLVTPKRRGDEEEERSA